MPLTTPLIVWAKTGGKTKQTRAAKSRANVRRVLTFL
jgi:hypothetical protein